MLGAWNPRPPWPTANSCLTTYRQLIYPLKVHVQFTTTIGISTATWTTTSSATIAQTRKAGSTQILIKRHNAVPLSLLLTVHLFPYFQFLLIRGRHSSFLVFDTLPT